MTFTGIRGKNYINTNNHFILRDSIEPSFSPKLVNSFLEGTLLIYFIFLKEKNIKKIN